MRVGPVAGDESSMPAQDCGGRDHEGVPAVSLQYAAQTGEDDTVAVVEARMWDPAAEHLDLFAQHEDLDILGPIALTTKDHQRQDPTEQLVDQRHGISLAASPLPGRNRRSTTRTEFPAPTG